MSKISPEASDSNTTILKTIIFLGSSRDVTPPWGGDSRVGDKVLKHLQSQLHGRESKVGPLTVTHDVTIYDPLVVFGPGGVLEASGAGLKTPTFFEGESTAEVKQMQEQIANADAYIIVAPEYNHSIPSSLTGLMNHFRPSVYKHRASGIIAYSMGPWGGMRMAMALRPFLGELGTIQCQQLVGFPLAHEMFKEDGTPTNAEDRMLKQLPDMLSELEYLAVAMKNQREFVSSAIPPAEASS